MPKKQSLPNKTFYSFSFFEILFIGWAGFVLLSIILTISSIFYSIIPILYIIFFVSIIYYLYKKKKLVISKLTTSNKLLLFGLVFWIGLLSYFTVPTIFGGRDEGSIATSALMINKNHSLNYQNKIINTFAKIYGEGKALNFPGFFYQKSRNSFILKSQFLPGYPAYLANFAYSTKINFLKFANAIPLLIFLLAFYSIVKQLTKEKYFSLVAVSMLITTTPLVIFYKFTLSEIFFASFIWSSLYFLLKYLQLKKQSPPSKKILSFWLIFIPLLPTVFIRIESFGIIFILILILIFKKHHSLQQPLYQIPLLLIIFLGVLSMVLFSNFFIIAGKGLLNTFINFNHQTLSSDQTKTFLPKIWQHFYLPKLFYTYNFLPFFLFGILAIVKLFKEKKWFFLTPLFFLGIKGFYLIDANISLDHPWMLRRFTFATIPLLILYTILFFQHYPLRQKLITKMIITVLITSNFLLSYPFVVFKQNNNLLEQTDKLAQQFTNQDLILVSQQASGSGWSLITEPLRTILNKQAVYFFNPNDYAKIDQTNYQHIYLISSQKEIPHYVMVLNNIQKEKPYTLKNQIIQPTKNPLQFPKLITTETNGIIYQLK
jgi:hypothetical protein